MFSMCYLVIFCSLGKTLQSIALLYTLLRQGFDGEPMAKKAIIFTPTSLVSNWESEIKKWVGDRLQLIALCESTGDDVVSGIDSFIRPRSPYQELDGISCNRRILLSGTPMQNDLEEFFAMVNFTNSGILGDAAYFRRYYESPIISEREPTATEEERNLSFILRRTNALLSNHPPPKRAISEEAKQSKILAYIPGSGTSGFEDCIRFFPHAMFSRRSGAWTGGDGVWVELSGKMHVLARLLAQLRSKTDDRIVVFSNYTQVCIHSSNTTSPIIV
ncbi:hypothetical protein MKW92_009522 [Papaver armeniacum]|nr:hypothetical protein MKW92_009522 [Papaver armeniacum]